MKILGATLEMPEVTTETWTFKKVRLARMGEDFPTEWMLRITSFTELYDYYLLTHPTKLRDAYSDFYTCMKDRPENPHFKNHITYAAATMGSFHEETFVDSINRLFDTVTKNQLRAIGEGKTVYIRSIGSYTTDSGESYDVLDEYVSEQLIFPHETVRFIQWPNGKHWYAKIGSIDVIVDGEQKWDTKEEAKKASDRFVKDQWKVPKNEIQKEAQVWRNTLRQSD